MKLTASLLLTLLITAQIAAGQNAGSGMDFLNIAPSANQLSLSEASSSTLTGASALYSNPALLVMEPSSSIELTYTLWIADVNNQFASANFLRDGYALAFGVYNSRSNDFEARDRPGPSQGDFSISYLSLSGAAAYKFGPVSAGITAQFLREEVFQLRANGYAINAGLAAELIDKRVRLGAAVQNLGEMDELDVESTTLPSTFRLGATANLLEFTTPGANDLPILVSVHTEWIQPLEDLPTSDFTDRGDSDDFFSLAGTVDVADLFDLRGGYKFGPTERPVSFGLGLNIEPVSVNYAVLPFSTGFGWVHSIGLQFYF